jgi:predicted nucleotidyltransferase
MNVTDYADINSLLDALLSQMQAILGQKLAGLYLYGSLVWGDFDYDISDIDLLAATATEIDEKEFAQLKAMQDELAQNYNQWDNRLEIAYVSLEALRTFKTCQSQIAIISPGEPFHWKEAGKDWLINWYVVQEKGLTLFGPPPQSVIEPISKAEYLQAVREQAGEWREYITRARQSRPYQGYAILTMCRALYAFKNGEQVSKKQAALWAQKELPEWAGLIQNAFMWREDSRNTQIDQTVTYPETAEFVNFVSNLITD